MSQAIQTNFDLNQLIGQVGDSADNSNDRGLSKVVSVGTSISFGLIAALQTANNDNGRLIRRIQANLVTLTTGADYVTSNVIAGTVTTKALDETVTTTAISVVFSSNHATTAALLATAIQAATGVLTAVVNGSDDKIIDIIANDDVDVDMGTFLVTLGAGQAVITMGYDTSDTVAGLTMSMQKEEVLNTDGSTSVKYNSQEDANVASQGAFFIASEDAVTVQDSVFFRVRDDGSNVAGTLTTAIGSPIDSKALSQAVFRSAAAADGISILELNKP